MLTKLEMKELLKLLRLELIETSDAILKAYEEDSIIDAHFDDAHRVLKDVIFNIISIPLYLIKDDENEND